MNPTPQPPALKLVLRRREAAAALSISERQLDYLNKAGEIRSFKVGTSVCYAVTELQRWVDEQQRQAGTADDSAVG